MLIIISDLHFVDGSAGDHNLPYEAFDSVFLSDITSLAVKNEAKEIKVLLLGDIFDLIRTRYWLNDVPVAERPWGQKGLQDVEDVLGGKVVNQSSPTMRHCENILAAIMGHSEVKKVLELFTNLREKITELEPGLMNVPIEVLYVPGNHDRMVNLYPSLRDKVKAALKLTVPEDSKHTFSNKEWGYGTEFKDSRYGVFARHGHLRDIWNYWDVNNYYPEGHLKVSVGDIFTTEFAVKIPFLMEQKLREGVKNGTFEKRTCEEIVNRLYDVDNVRPVRSVPDWIDYRLSDIDNRAVEDLLEGTLKQVIDELLSIKLLQEWNSPDTFLDEGLRFGARSRIHKLFTGIIDRFDLLKMLPHVLGTSEVSGDSNEAFAEAAYKETAWKGIPSNFNYIVYGHTHDPLIRPLEGVGTNEVLYVNTGTWRPRIMRSVKSGKDSDFIMLKSMTYAAFYRDDEDLDSSPQPTKKKAHSFEFWNGWQKKFYA